MLTGKAQKDYEKWMKDEIIILPEGGFNSLSDKFKASLILEWLDSVGIHVVIGYVRNIKQFIVEINTDDQLRTDINLVQDRNLAMGKGIELANEIYNSR